MKRKIENPWLAASWPAVAIAVAGFCGTAAAQTTDPVIFSFSTVGDSRTDPNSPDATTLLANPSPTTQGGMPSLSGSILPQDAKFVQNTLAFSTILNGIQAQNPNLLFFNGDMIFGYGRPTLPSAWSGTGITPANPATWKSTQSVSPDAAYELAQYAYWRGMVSPLFLNGTYVIPVPGNHETQCSYSAAPYSSSSGNPGCATKSANPSGVTGPVNGTGKTAYADNENMFRLGTADLVQDLTANLRFSNVSGYFATSVSSTAPTGDSITAPTPSNLSNGPITGDQHFLSYSFDIQPQSGLLLHFVVLNTDPSGADTTAPAAWLASDLAAAKTRGSNASSTVKYFVFGHKAAFTYNYAAATGGSVAPPSTNSPGPGGLDANYTGPTGGPYSTPYRDTFWSVIAQYGATYFCGHEHTVNVQKYADPTQTSTNQPYQVIVGSGGSPFDDKLGSGNSEPTLTNPYDRYYAWATVKVHASGNVSLQVSGFSDQFGAVQDLGIYDVATLQ